MSLFSGLYTYQTWAVLLVVLINHFEFSLKKVTEGNYYL